MRQPRAKTIQKVRPGWSRWSLTTAGASKPWWCGRCEDRPSIIRREALDYVGAKARVKRILFENLPSAARRIHLAGWQIVETFPETLGRLEPITHLARRRDGGGAPLRTVSMSTNRPSAAAFMPSLKDSGTQESSCSAMNLATSARSCGGKALNRSMTSCALALMLLRRSMHDQTKARATPGQDIPDPTIARAESRGRSAGFVTGLNATIWLRSKPIGNRRSAIAAQRVSVFLNAPWTIKNALAGASGPCRRRGKPARRNSGRRVHPGGMKEGSRGSNAARPPVQCQPASCIPEGCQQAAELQA